jgi:8-amino-7-oxononanoate synthase
MGSLDQFAADKLAALAARSLARELATTDRGAAPRVRREGRELLSFSCNDYLNLATHPEIVAAAIAATTRYGVGAGGARAVTGNHPLYAELEARLARRKRTDAALVFGSGYLANSGLIPALLGKDDLLLVDELAHACLWAGAKLSSARILPFAHNDSDALAALLAAERHRYPRAIIATETVFSMDGDRAPVGAIADLAERYDAWALTDDAHGLGVVPPDPATARIPLQMGTLSKAVGGYGGYLCAGADVVGLMRNRARSWVYTTGLPPATVAAAAAALDFMDAHPAYCARPLALAQRFTRLLNLPEAASPIVPMIVGSATAALALSQKLADEGLLVTAIRPPTVPDGTARLRMTFCAAHSEADVGRLADALTRHRP